MTADPSRAPKDQAFTLLELMMALGVLLIIAAGAVGLVESSLQIGVETVDAQNRRLEKTATHSFLRTLIGRVPGTSEFSLVASDDGDHPQLILRSLPPDVLKGIPGGSSGNLLLSSEKSLGGYVRLTVVGLTQDEASESPDAIPNTEFESLILLDRVSNLKLRLFDPALREWVVKWETGRRPTLCEITLGIDGDTAQRFVFSIPPAAVPQNNSRTRSPERTPSPVDPTPNTERRPAL